MIIIENEIVNFQGFQPALNRQGAYKGGVLLTREGCFSQRRGLVERGHAEVGSFLKTC